MYWTLCTNFLITLGLMKSNDYVILLNVLHIDLYQCKNLHESVLTPFSSFLVYRKTDRLEVDWYVLYYS